MNVELINTWTSYYYLAYFLKYGQLSLPNHYSKGDGGDTILIYVGFKCWPSKQLTIVDYYFNTLRCDGVHDYFE